MSLKTEAEEQTGAATAKMKTNTENPQMEEMTLADIKRRSSLLPGTPRGAKGLAKSSSARCLCSPTTHAGSFRCRHHRNLGLGGMLRAGSVGSNLSLLGTKSATVGESNLNACDSSLF